MIIALGLGIFNSACTIKPASKSDFTPGIIDSLIPKYSHSFRVDYYDTYRVVRVYAGDHHKPVANYILYTDIGRVTVDHTDAALIPYPALRVACMSTTHVGALKLLDARSLIVAATNTNFIYDSMVTALIHAGLIKNAGSDYKPDYELIAQAKPYLLFSDGENSGSSQMYAKMKALGIDVVCSRDYFEQEPLARAEWIKFFAAFIGKERQADSIFDVVCREYQKQAKIKNYEDFPPYSVFCNLPYNGVWYMPCGENYVAKLIKDAGGDFLWEKDKAMNGLNLTLNFEQVYLRAGEADVWINPGTARSLRQIETMSSKFGLFKAFQNKRVYNCTKRMSPGGGMDIWETGTFRPDIVLSDLRQIRGNSYPSPASLYYYEQLK